MLKLHIQDDEGKTTVVPFTGEDITIGRQEDSSIQLTERNVSRCHARLFKKSQQVFVEDVSSSYGTRVNGIKIAQAMELKVSDVIQIGDYRIQYRTELGEYRNRNRGGDTAIVDLSALQASEGKINIPAHKQALLHATDRGLDDEYNITTSPITIGQAPDSDWSINHRSLSPHHAEIRYENGQYVLADLGTAAGIRVNGEPYQQVLLTPGDEITIGRLRIQFLMGVNASSDPSVWETAVMDVIPSTRPGSNKGKGILVVAATAVIAAIALSVLYFSKYEGGPELPQEPEATEAAEPPSTEEAPPPEEPETKEDSASEYLAKAQVFWKNDQKARAYNALEQAGETDEARILSTSFTVSDKMDDLYLQTADGNFAEVLEEVSEISLNPESPMYDGLKQRYEDLRAAAEEGRLEELYDAGSSLARKKKTRETNKIINQIRAIDPSSERADKLERKLKSNERSSETTARKNKQTKRSQPTYTPPKPRKEPRVKPEASGNPDDWYKDARKLRNSDPSKALKLLNKVVRAKPSHFKAHKMLGMLYHSRGKTSLAIKHFKKALTIRNDPGIKQFLERIQ